MAVALTLWTALLLACGQARLPVHPQPPGRDFLIIGHRGAPQQACENTLESFETALHLGANALELDLSLTRDQQVVVWHDWRPSLTSVLRPTGLCRLRHPLRPQPLHDVPLHEALRDYGYERDGHHVPLLTFTRVRAARGPGCAGAVRVSGSAKFLRSAPTSCPRSSSRPCRPCSARTRWRKRCSSRPMSRSFAQLRHEAQRWQQTTQTPVDSGFRYRRPRAPPGDAPGPRPSTAISGPARALPCGGNRW